MNPHRKKGPVFFITLSLLAAFSCYQLERWCHRQTEGFRVSNLFLQEPLACQDPLVEMPPSLHSQALSQPYFFLASGGESYVFESQDKKWVLKFFKNHHFTSLSWMEKIPLPANLAKKRTEFLEKRRFLTKRFWESCQIASTTLSDETALAFLQIIPHLKGSQPIVIYDKIGIKHVIPLEKVPFALQRKVELYVPALQEDIAKGDIEAAHAKIHQALSAAAGLLSKGIKNWDPEMKRNLGWEGSKVVFVDVGAFEKKEEPILDRAEALRFATHRLDAWLLQDHKDLWSFYDKELVALAEKEP